MTTTTVHCNRRIPWSSSQREQALLLQLEEIIYEKSFFLGFSVQRLLLKQKGRPLVEVLVATVGTIRLLANVERNIPVLDHVADLALHRQRK